MEAEVKSKKFEWQVLSRDGKTVYAYKYPGEPAVIYNAEAAIQTLMTVVANLAQRGVERYDVDSPVVNN